MLERIIMRTAASQMDGIDDEDDLMKDYMKEMGGGASAGASGGGGPQQRPDVALALLLARGHTHARAYQRPCNLESRSVPLLPAASRFRMRPWRSVIT